jgi:hypothetical protein
MKTKMKVRKIKQVLPWGGAPVEVGEDIRKGCTWVNMVEILGTHV